MFTSVFFIPFFAFFSHRFFFHLVLQKKKTSTTTQRARSEALAPRRRCRSSASTARSKRSSRTSTGPSTRSRSLSLSSRRGSCSKVNKCFFLFRGRVFFFNSHFFYILISKKKSINQSIKNRAHRRHARPASPDQVLKAGRRRRRPVPRPREGFRRGPHPRLARAPRCGRRQGAAGEARLVLQAGRQARRHGTCEKARGGQAPRRRRRRSGGRRWRFGAEEDEGQGRRHRAQVKTKR